MNSKLKNIMILATGGTIAGVGDEGSSVGYHSGVIDIDDIIEEVKPIKKLGKLKALNLFKKDSTDIDGTDLCTIVNAVRKFISQENVDGIVITHGTDTLEETAYFLNLLIDTKKPIVLTGSMRPASATSPDGPINLYEAVVCAVSDESYDKGVLVVFNDEIYAARDVQKVNSFKTNAFGSKDFGSIGYLRENKAYYINKSVKRHTSNSEFNKLEISKLEQVPIIYFSQDDDCILLDLIGNNFKGIIIAGAGSGTLSQKYVSKLKNISNETIIIRSSRVGSGITVFEDLFDGQIGSIPSLTLPPFKARILLRIALTQGIIDKKEIYRIFSEY